MVYAKGHNAPWSIHEQRTLLESYLTGSDWGDRSSLMAKEFSDTRGRGFFTHNTCQAEFERIMQSPCPGHKPSGSTSTTYSRKALVDIWIKHLDRQIEEEDKKTFELELVEIRNKSAIIERLMGSQKQFSSEEIRNMLSKARLEDSKKVLDQQQLCHVVNCYMHRLKEVVHDNIVKDEEMQCDPPVLPSDTTAESIAESSSSPTRIISPLKSPIRPIADVIRENMSPAIEQSVSTLLIPSDTQLMEGPESIESAADAPESDEDSGEQEIQKADKKKSRGRAKKEPKEEPESVSEEGSSATPAKENNRRKSSRNEPVEDIHVENSPAGNRRSSRRGVVDSPLVSGRSKKGRGNEAEPEPEERKSDPEPVESPEAVISGTTSVPAPEESIPFVPAFTEIGTSTEISVQGPLWTHQEKKENRRSTSGRKSTRRSEIVVETADDKKQTHRDREVQTKKIEFDKEDKLVVSWNTSERFFVRTIAIEQIRACKQEEWDDEDDMALANLAKQRNSTVQSADDEEDEKKGKHDPKKEILVLYDTDEWLARALVTRPNHRYDDGKGYSSPNKRPRKEEKSKEENNQIKNVLLNVWRIVCNHKHSGIFSHPVNEKEAPGYSEAIKQKMDLSTLKKEIENGQVSNMIQLKMKLNLMFANAVMFNSTGHDVNTYAQEMAKETMDELLKLGALDRKAPVGLSRRSRVHEDPIASQCMPKSRSVGNGDVPTGKVRQLFTRKPPMSEVRRVVP